MIKSILLVGLGGGIGSILRYLVSWAMGKISISHFPWATFIVNIIGSFAIGLLWAYVSQKQDDTLKLLLITGVCGGFTTFSAFSIENISLLQTGHYQMAAIYILSSILLGFATAFLGVYIAVQSL